MFAKDPPHNPLSSQLPHELILCLLLPLLPTLVPRQSLVDLVVGDNSCRHSYSHCVRASLISISNLLSNVHHETKFITTTGWDPYGREGYLYAQDCCEKTVCELIHCV